MASSRRDRRGAVPGLVEPLSERELELEVLGLLAVGRSNQQIAEELAVALDTTKKHVSRILDKLGVANRTRRSPAPRNWSCSGNAGRPASPMARSCIPGPTPSFPRSPRMGTFG